MIELFVQRMNYSPGRRLLAVLISSGLLYGMASVHAAESEGWVAPGGIQSLNSLMDGSGGENGYGLETLVTQGRASGTPSDITVRGRGDGNGRSVIEDMVTPPSAAVSAHKALKIENRKLKAQVSSLMAQMSELQTKLADEKDATKQAEEKSVNSVSETELKAMAARAADAEKNVSTLSSQLQEFQRKLDITQDDLKKNIASRAQSENQRSELFASLTARDKVLQDKTMQLATRDATLKLVQQQVASLIDEKDGLQQQLEDSQVVSKQNIARLALVESKLSDTSKQLEKTKEQASKEANVPVDTPLRQQAYVVGQAMAASLRERLNGYDETGMKLDRARVIAGLSDGLRSRIMMKRSDMDTAWQNFTGDLQKHIGDQVKSSEAMVRKLVDGRKPSVIAEGIQYFVVKKGQAVKDKDALRSLSLTEQLASNGRIISQVPRLTLSPDDDMPSVVRNALPLLGPGADVEVYALARAVYGERTLPKGVTPYAVLHYRMKGLIGQ